MSRNHPAEQLRENAIVQESALELPRLHLDEIVASN